MLPPLPELTFHREPEPVAAPDAQAFVRVRRHRITLRTASKGESKPFLYDEAWRESLDAATIAAHYRDGEGQRHVYLRSAFRPPVALRPALDGLTSEFSRGGQLWELPAGLLEADERHREGPRAGAARELAEELGFFVAPSALQPLGPPTFCSPGLCGERIVFFHVEVNPAERREPAGDGSALEEVGLVADVLLEDALRLWEQGGLEDMKTEIGLRRLAALT